MVTKWYLFTLWSCSSIMSVNASLIEPGLLSLHLLSTKVYTDLSTCGSHGDLDEYSQVNLLTTTCIWKIVKHVKLDWYMKYILY